MRSPWLWLFLLPAVVYGAGNLYYECGDTVWVYSYTISSYSISTQGDFHSTCRVTFKRENSGGEINLVISGYNLRSSDCQVQVLDSSYSSKSYGNITGYSSFSKTFQSTDNSGELYLKVTGDRCYMSALTFTASKVDCVGYTCSNGQCVDWSDVCDGWDDCSDGSDEDGCYVFWNTRVSVGVGVGIAGFLFVVAVVIGACYRRRRVMLMASPGTIVASQTAVTQSRW